MSQKLYWVIIYIFLFPCMAKGTEWVRIPAVNHFYIDVDSIKQVAPNQYEAWFKAELINDGLIKEAERYSFFDCAERKAKALKTITYLRDGMTDETGEEGLENVPPNDTMMGVLQFVCTYKKGVLQILKREDK